MWASTAESPVLLLGAAHVVDLEGALRRRLVTRPLDAVAVELDAERAEALLAPTPPAAGSRREVPLLLRVWGHLQRRLGADIGGGIAGAEMLAAARIAKERALPLLLIDDPIRETMPRLLAALSVRERLGLLVGAVVGLVIPSRVVRGQIDRYNEAPAPFLEEVRRAYPGVARVLLDDRNEHMADRLVAARARGLGRIAAVVGDAHVPGLSAALQRRGVPTEQVPLAELVGGATAP